MERKFHGQSWIYPILHNKTDRFKTIWQQGAEVSGQGHYGHRMMFGSDGKLWVSSGERQKFDPALDMQSNLADSASK